MLRYLLRHPIGFIVFEQDDECNFEQALKLITGDDVPRKGILAWKNQRESAAVFPTRKEARAAIDRTEHYRLAYENNSPQRKNCKIHPVETILNEEPSNV
jgi:hypothetical protein